MNFATIENNDTNNNQKELTNADNTTEVRKSNFKKFENQTSVSSEIKPQEVRESNLSKFGNQTLASSENEPQEVRKANANYTDTNYTDLNYTNPIYPSREFDTRSSQDGDDRMDIPNAYMEIIKENIEYDHHMQYDEWNNKDMFNYVSDIRRNPEAMDKIAELIAKVPDAKIYRVIPPQIEDKIQEYRYAGMSEAEQLADRIDQFTKEYDPYEYADAVPDREAHLQQLVSDIEQGEAGYVANYLQNVMEESADQTDLKIAKELADKLKEYKPLAKVEELEEQNYNMIDNVLNNDCEKINKREEKQQYYVSLKERLEKKKEKIAIKQLKEKPEIENIKGQQRGI